MGVEDQVDAAGGLVRAQVQVAAEAAGALHEDALPLRLEHEEVGVRPALDPAELGVEDAPPRTGRRSGACRFPAGPESR